MHSAQGSLLFDAEIEWCVHGADDFFVVAVVVAAAVVGGDVVVVTARKVVSLVVVGFIFVIFDVDSVERVGIIVHSAHRHRHQKSVVGGVGGRRRSWNFSSTDDDAVKASGTARVISLGGGEIVNNRRSEFMIVSRDNVQRRIGSLFVTVDRTGDDGPTGSWSRRRRSDGRDLSVHGNVVVMLKMVVGKRRVGGGGGGADGSAHLHGGGCAGGGVGGLSGRVREFSVVNRGVNVVVDTAGSVVIGAIDAATAAAAVVAAAFVIRL